jgi:16S rRNA (adenine1518-N6/adenine1519-N6)-dimethyltransferase
VTGPAQLLRTLEARARKRFGQHFLASDGVVRRIVEVAEVGPESRVLEVGPGLGVLTEALVATGAHVVAVELDRDLVGFLTERLPSVQLIEGDAAKLDWDAALDGAGWQVVANLPYNVGTRIVTQLLARPDKVRRLTVMVQREVAARMVAPAGDRKRGSLSVYVEARAKAAVRIRVPPGAFHPPPKVHSAVVDMQLLETPGYGNIAVDHFDKVVRSAFIAPRKTVRNTLRSRFDGDRVDAALATADIDPRARPSTLTVRAFRELAAHLPVG